MAPGELLSHATAKLGRLRDPVWGRIASKGRIRTAMLYQMPNLGMMILGTTAGMTTGGEVLVVCLAMRNTDLINELDTSNLHVVLGPSRYAATAPRPGLI